jgi:hypothetical protein
MMSIFWRIRAWVIWHLGKCPYNGGKRNSPGRNCQFDPPWEELE